MIYKAPTSIKNQGAYDDAHIILARIKPTLLSHRRPQQSGFMPGRSTCDRIATLCNIAQRRQDFGHWTFAAFVDLRAAFDSLSRPTLWLLLTRLGILDKTVRLFRVLYDNSVSCVRTGGTHSSWFKIEADVRQRCMLAPDSFATGMDWLLTMSLPCWTARASCSSCSHIGDNCKWGSNPRDAASLAIVSNMGTRSSSSSARERHRQQNPDQWRSSGQTPHQSSKIQQSCPATNPCLSQMSLGPASLGFEVNWLWAAGRICH